MTSVFDGDWARVESLLGEALELPLESRDAFVTAACGHDAALLAEVRSLLEAHARTGVVDKLAHELAPLTAQLRPASGDSQSGRQIGRYRLLDRLGDGGMGVVYEALDEQLGQRRALKFLPPHLTRDLEARKRFEAEARAAAALDHPNICTVYEVGETELGERFLVMPVYAGETLERRIARGPLPVCEAVSLAAQVTRGLETAHTAGIIHRDIKPSNLFITTDGVLKILDFGVAKLSDSVLTKSGAGPLGTPAYMSPEQALGERVDVRTDLWSLGIVLYEMLSGARPFRGFGAAMLMRIVSETPTPVAALGEARYAELQSVLSQSLEKRAANRPASAAAMGEALRRSAAALAT